MVENKIRKIERKETLVCETCNNTIPKEILEKSVEGVKNLYCQYCGVSLNLFPDPIDNIVSGESPIISPNTQKESNLTKIKQISQKSDLTLSYSNIRNALRSYIYQLIYQLLTNTPVTLKKMENKKELKSSHINIILKKLWNELKDLNRNDLANQELVSSRRRIRNYFEEFQSSLRPYKKFRKVNFALFAENIEFVFGLILGDYEFSNLATSKKRIVLNLKKSFGFKSDTATTNSFTYNISLIVSKKIRSILSQYHITEGNDNKLALDEIIGHVIDYIVTNKDNLSDLSEFNNSKKKKFHKTLEILIANLKTDWIYRKSFEDHIYRLIIVVNSLMSDADYSSNLIGFERLISQGLTQSALFEKDQDFSPHFKLNLTLILCRIIYIKIKNSPSITKLSSQPVNLSITEENEIRNSILDEITAGKKINSQLLKKFYKFSLEKFQTYYEKLQLKLSSDLIYVESFRNYLSDLVKLVFTIVHSISKKSHLTQLELAVVKDLANYNFEWFYKKPERTYFYYLNSTNHSNEDEKSINLTLNNQHLDNSSEEKHVNRILKLAKELVDKMQQQQNENLKELGYDGSIPLKEFVLYDKDIARLLQKGIIKDIDDLIGIKGMLRYGFVGFTYRAIDRKTMFFQSGLSFVPHPNRLNYYLRDCVFKPKKYQFKKTGTNQIYGWIAKAIDRECGLASFRKEIAEGKIGSLYKALNKMFKFEITGVFWGEKSVRNAEDEQIAVTLLNTDRKGLIRLLSRTGIGYDILNPSSLNMKKITEIRRKYGISKSMIGMGLNDPLSSGHGGYPKYIKSYIWRCGYYTALGMLQTQMHEEMKKNGFYKKSLPAFRWEYARWFGNLKQGRELFFEPILEGLKELYGYSESDLNRLFPLAKKFDKELFIHLTEENYELLEIAEKMGHNADHLGDLAKDLIPQEYDFIEQYKFTSNKKQRSFEDLQYYLVAQKILRYYLEDKSRGEIITSFDGGISNDNFREVLKRVLHTQKYSELRNVAEEPLLRLLILDINPSQVSDIVDDSRCWMSKFTMYKKLKIYYKNNPLVQRLLSRKNLNSLEMARAAIVGTELEKYYKLGLSDKLILRKLNNKYTLTEIRDLTILIWGRDPDSVRLMLHIGVL